MKVVLYTCTFLDYDQIFSPVRVTPGLDHVIFADRRPRFARRWRWRPLPAETQGMSQTLANRYCKFFPHRLLPEADISIYVDGNTLVLDDLTPLIAEFSASEADIGLFRHMERNNLFEEFEFAKQVGKIDPEDAERGARQIAHYRAEGLPDDHVFTENGIIFRRHHAPALDGAMRLWWKQITTFTRRDQISLPYVLHESQIRTKVWNWNYKSPNAYFKRYPHRADLYTNVNTCLRNLSYHNKLCKAVIDPALVIFRKLLKASPANR